MKLKTSGNKSRLKYVNTLVIFLLALAFISVLPLPFAYRSQPTELAPVVVEQPEVRVTVSQASTYYHKFVTQGALMAKRSVLLPAKIRAKVTHVFASEGLLVFKDDLLYILENESFGLELIAAKKQFEKAELDFNALKSEDESLFSEREKLQIEAAYNQAKASWIKLQQTTGDYFVRAPFDGIIEQISVIENVEPDNNKPTVKISDVLTLTATLQISEQEARKLKKDAKVKITPKNLDLVLEGTITQIGEVIDAETMSTEVKVEISNPDNAIKSGHIASFEFLSLPVKAHRVQPYTLTTTSSGKLGVLAVDDRNIVRFYESTFVAQDLQGVWITGLPEVLRIITRDQSRFQPGDKIPVVQTKDNTEDR